MPEVCVSEEGVCCKDHLPVKFSDPKFKNEIFVRIDMKHSYCSNYLFALIFSVDEAVVVSQKLMHVMHNFCSCCIKKFKVTNLTLYMYMLIEIS